MTSDEARDLLLRRTEDEAQHLLGLRIKEAREKARREADRKAREIIVTAVQRARWSTRPGRGEAWCICPPTR